MVVARILRWIWLFSCVGLTSGVTTSASAQRSTQPSTQRSRSRSIGASNRGRLEAGARLAATPHLELQPGDSAFYGTQELVGLIRRAAERAQEERPGPRLLVGDLSRRGGGRLRPHSSHQNGRDADIGFYVTDENGQPIEPRRFVELGDDACGRDRGTTYCLDGERTFLLIAAMLEDPVARIQFVLVAPDIRELLLAAGRRLDVPGDVLERVTTVTEPRGGSEAHRSHFHVRIYCPVDDRPHCEDGAPYHEWYDGEPPTIQRARARRRRPRARQRRRRRGHRSR